jgi:threonine dehydrogenase-like Zn-dependent dehydrogenase
MNALVWRSKQNVEIQQVPKPMITDPKDIILKVTATSICGSDLHLYSGSVSPMGDGDILGHEFMGIIEEVGDQVQKLKKGERVVVAFDIACGSCDFCKREEFTACKATNPSNLCKEQFGHRTSAIYGYSHLTGGVPGGQADYVRVPYADVNCLSIPEDITDESALFLSDLIPTAWHGCELASIRKGTRLLFGD